MRSVCCPAANAISAFTFTTAHKHRYRPKVSRDGKPWRLLDESDFERLLDETAVRFDLRVGPEPLYIAAQELVTNTDYASWRQAQATSGRVEVRETGRSLGNRPIHARVTPGQGSDWVLVTGRQHPPEITGALALLSFVERLLGQPGQRLVLGLDFHATRRDVFYTRKDGEATKQA